MSDLERSTSHERRIRALEQQVEQLQSSRPGRKKVPIVVSHGGLCGVDPNSDSSTCPHASLYRRQQGCQGDACVRASSEYYRQYRSNRNT